MNLCQSPPGDLGGEDLSQTQVKLVSSNLVAQTFAQTIVAQFTVYPETIRLESIFNDFSE